MEEINVICPGIVKSKNDGDEHYISFGQLISLYGLDRRTCISSVFRIDTTKYNRINYYRPRYDGNYERRA